MDTMHIRVEFKDGHIVDLREIDEIRVSMTHKEIIFYWRDLRHRITTERCNLKYIKKLEINP